MNKFIIITTINKKTEAISEFEAKDDWNIIVVGDKKSKPISSSNNLKFLSVSDQKKLGFNVVEKLPYNHYARKNIGYLYAIREGADIIYDTDDDNLPYPDWQVFDFECSNIAISESNVINIYKYFTDEFVWPRGYPLNKINQKNKLRSTNASTLKIGVWQGMADNSPDVDAIYRLLFNKPITFQRRDPIALQPGTFCPFNSQNTTWSKNAFPFLYLPSTTSFRFTDILRGFITQRLLWESNFCLGFHHATVYQNRNYHDFMKDFADEVECYLNTGQIINILQETEFSSEPLLNLDLVYNRLCKNELISGQELNILEAWRMDFENITKH